MSYWDASALAKLHFPEPDSPTFRQFAAGSPAPPVTARLGVLEMERVAWFKETNGQSTPADRAAVLSQLAAEVSRGDVRVVEWNEAVEKIFAQVLQTCFSQRPPVVLRTADAMHLAAALLAGETEMVSTDTRLREAARLCGLTLFPPT